MKKILITLLSLFICIVSACNCSYFVYAEGNTVKQYDGYMAFGDSITRGLIGNDVDQDTDAYTKTLRNVEGSYPYLVSQAVGCNKSSNSFSNKENCDYWPVCYMGITLSMTLDMLNINERERDEVFDHGIFGDAYKALDELFGEAGSQGTVKSILESYQSDEDVLITSCLGLSDIALRPLNTLVTDEIKGKLASGELDLDANQIAELLNNLLKKAEENYKNWSEDYDKFIRKLKEYNENATIVLVGYFNPFREVTITDKTVLPLGDVFNPIISKMNSRARQIARNNGCIFVDISNTESTAIKEEWSILDILDDLDVNTTISSHPTKESYQYISRQIINSLPLEELSEENVNTYNIRVDLIRYNKVSKVILNNKVLRENEYELSDTILNIPYNNEYARSLQVYIVDENGKTSILSYNLKFIDGKYEPRCIDSTNDIAEQRSKVRTNIETIVSFIRETTKKLIPWRRNKSDIKEPVSLPKQEDINEIYEKVEENNDDSLMKPIELPREIEENIEEIKQDIKENIDEYKQNEDIKQIHEQTTENIKKAVEVGQEVTKDIIEKSVENFKKLGEDIKEHIENSPLPKQTFPQFPINH